MPKLKFTKITASGNDFILLGPPHSKNARWPELARKICDRKYGIGADGLLVIGKSKAADMRMRIFNADGSEAEMCGNGARSVAFWKKSRHSSIQTRAGIIQARVNRSLVKIKLTDPKGLKLDIPLKINNRRLKVNFINTGVPHAVVFVSGIDKIDVFNLGRQVRYHKYFAPAGTNVDFVEVLGRNSIRLRTYERGVEDETLACGTGTVAAALITADKAGIQGKCRIKVLTQGRETLRVYFTRQGKIFSDVWLEGKVSIAYQGVYYV